MLDFRILGPVEVWRDGDPVPLGSAKQRAALALLILEAGRVVSTDRLVDALWGEQPPRTAATSLQNFVSRLRKSLGNDTLVTKPSGYQLAVRPEQVDAERFRSLCDDARTGHHEPVTHRPALGRSHRPGPESFARPPGTGNGRCVQPGWTTRCDREHRWGRAGVEG